MNENPLKAGLPQQRIRKPFTFVIFGASGDLTRAKIIPALYSLFKSGYIVDFKIVGFARRQWSDSEWRSRVREMLAPESTASRPDESIAMFCERVFFISSDFENENGYVELRDRFKEPQDRIYYLATPPSEYSKVVRRLSGLGLASEGSGFARIIAEKPFGSDLESAKNLNKELLSAFSESQVYRIDHYLGKEVVQNILVLRFANSIFEPVWSNRLVDHVQITVAEKAGIGTRGNFYESAGALRDVIQNHGLQMLSIVAMEPPLSLKPDDIRNEKVRVLLSLRPMTRDRLASEVVFGQYEPGIIDGAMVPGYRQEANVNPASEVETYAAIACFIDTPRWEGVPFLVRTGKRLSRKLTEISMRFKPLAKNIFSRWFLPQDEANTLTIRIQPDEGVIAHMSSKLPGFGQIIRPVNMNFFYGSSFGDELPEAYERLLLDAIDGDSTLYMRNDEIEASWEYTGNIVSLREEAKNKNLAMYPAGGQGPEEAARLAVSFGAMWRKL